MEQPGVYDTVIEEIPPEERRGTRTTSMYITIDESVMKNPRLFMASPITTKDLSNPGQ